MTAPRASGSGAGVPAAASAAGVPPALLVCFAVRQEAKPFQNLIHDRSDVSVLITGMGMANAERSVRKALQKIRPARVFTCGFAGALAPEWRVGDVVFETSDSALSERLRLAGAQPARFCCAERVAVTRAEKAALRQARHADAVEMESAAIQKLCREAEVACVLLRVISDTADEDLPLDFNALMNERQQLSVTRLAMALMKSPQRIPALIRLGRNSALAAERLARVLAQVI
jgi:adenosylhomocysteine nucleosidase